MCPTERGKTMSKLYEYEDHYVEIVDSKGVTHRAYVDGYTQALDNEENEASIDVLPHKYSHSGIEFFESDIKLIRIIEK